MMNDLAPTKIMTGSARDSENGCSNVASAGKLMSLLKETWRYFLWGLGEKNTEFPITICEELRR